MKDRQPIRVLLIEDDEADAHLLREMVSETGYVPIRLEQASRLSDALERLAHERFDVVLSDLGLPDSLGVGTIIKVQSHAPDTPVIVLSGLADETLAIQAVRKGAQDYLVKGSFDGNLLVRSILYSIERKKLLLQLENSIREIKTLRGLIPMCAWCRKLRDDDGYWKQVETYVMKHTDAAFTHGICPECAEKTTAEYRRKRRSEEQGPGSQSPG
jgi:DNA-binding NtrC family response regulator